MIKTIIQKNNYQDSIVLMLLTNQINTIEGVNTVSIMMGTPANKDIFKTGGLYTEELEQATPNDIAIVMDIQSEEIADTVLEEMEKFLKEKAQGSAQEGSKYASVKNWDAAVKQAADAKVALFSIPGSHAALEIERALDEGYHVFCFSDNVAIEDEKRLKEKAHEQGLLLMGPDCGTGIINGIPLAFTNNVRQGNIGIVGASGTGIQEVSTLIHKFGGGISHAIGTGGRDLKEAVGGVTFLDAIDLLEQDLSTEVIVVISKPAAPSIQEKVMAKLSASSKPVVTLFLGVEPTAHEENFYHAYTLEETARLAVAAAKHTPIADVKGIQPYTKAVDVHFAPEQTAIRGIYSGGTLAHEASVLIKSALQIDNSEKAEGYMLKANGHEIIDLGDDIYTQGRPHPMIAPEKRIETLRALLADETVAVVLLDVVLGHGSHDNMAEQLAPVLTELSEQKRVVLIGVLVGTDLDPQSYQQQSDILQKAGVILADSNAQAVQLALHLIGHDVPLVNKDITAKALYPAVETPVLPDSLTQLLTTKSFLNIGLRSFAETISEQGGQVVQFDWQPIAGGNVTLQRALQFLRKYNFNEEA